MSDLESINNSIKFGCLFFRGFSCELPDNFEFKFDKNIIFSTTILNVEDETWQKWLGLKWEDIKKSNAMVKIEIPTKEPDVLNNENKTSEEQCDTLYYALQLSGDFNLEATHFVTGSKVNNKINIRHWKQFNTWFHSINKGRILQQEDFSILGKLYERLRYIDNRSKSGDFFRIKRGIRNFQKGCEENYSDFRLPCFVRSLEALILPEIGKTTIQFKKRASLWWPKKFQENSELMLGEIYDKRCKFDHLHGAEEYNENELSEQQYRCEETARNAYQTILLDDEKLESFSTDDKISKYWKDVEGEKKREIV